VAKFKVAPSYTLSVIKAGSGASAGHVASDAAHPGINCDPDCGAQYQTGANVVLTATVTGVGVFSSWSGCPSSVGNQCTVVIGTTNVSVTANFTAYQLTVIKQVTGGASGTVTSSDTRISCGTTCSATYNPGTVVTLSVAVSQGGFVGWSGDVPAACTPALPAAPPTTCQVTMSAARNVTATFSAVTLTLIRAGSGSGSVNVDPPAADCSTSTMPCTYTYAPGASVQLNATPAVGSTFGSFSGGGCSASPCTTTLSSSTTITVTFNSTPSYTLTVTLQGTGAASSTVTVNPSPGPYLAGTPVTLTANPGAGVAFTGFSGGGCGATSPCTVTMNSNIAVTATFRLIRTLTVNVVGTGGTVTVPGSVLDPGSSTTTTATVRYLDGTLVNLTSSSAVGTVLMSWVGGCVGNGPACAFTIVSDTTVTATFAPGYALTVSKSGSGTVTGTGISCGSDCYQPFSPSTIVTLTATPGASYSFTGWGGNCSGTGSCTLLMNATKSVTATFIYSAPRL
jgi:hypothetical protein